MAGQAAILLALLALGLLVQDKSVSANVCPAAQDFVTFKDTTNGFVKQVTDHYNNNYASAQNTTDKTTPDNLNIKYEEMRQKLDPSYIVDLALATGTAPPQWPKTAVNPCATELQEFNGDTIAKAHTQLKTMIDALKQAHSGWLPTRINYITTRPQPPAAIQQQSPPVAASTAAPSTLPHDAVKAVDSPYAKAMEKRKSSSSSSSSSSAERRRRRLNRLLSPRARKTVERLEAELKKLRHPKSAAGRRKVRQLTARIKRIQQAAQKTRRSRGGHNAAAGIRRGQAQAQRQGQAAKRRQPHQKRA